MHGIVLYVLTDVSVNGCHSRFEMLGQCRKTYYEKYISDFMEQCQHFWVKRYKGPRNGFEQGAESRKIKVPSLSIFDEYDGAHLRFISLWATQLYKHSECYSWGWPSGITLCFAPMLFPEVLNAKQGNSMYHFSSLW